ncbi:MAG: hypothetical protein LLG06_05330, partial [Desulfobacteraceae bacterium]|nr:hypothetical protein [Desulfobacteraceae bacterium]
SYDSNSYCADPPSACVEYCITGDATAKSACEAACPNVTASFTDTIISNSAVNGTLRTTYCPLIYPKTQRTPNPDSAGNYIYYKAAYPMYSSSAMGGEYMFGYAGSDAPGTWYSPTNGPPYATYRYYYNKTNTSNSFSGYSSYFDTMSFEPSDTDKSLGYYNFGQRLDFYYIGRTWFSNSKGPSPQGYIKAVVGDLTDSTKYSALVNQLDPKENDSAGYLSCTTTSKNSCSYVVNAGHTPSAGALKSALNYFAGTYTGKSTPITLTCQKNYIIYVTDGLPDTKIDGTMPSSLSSILPEVITQLNALQTGVTVKLGTKNYTFPIKTYVLGMGLSSQAKTNLDKMAAAGGTATSSGHAYYADSADQLLLALETIATDLLGRVASGSSISILSEGQTQMGSNMLQGVFYPTKYFGSTDISWPGYLYNYWFYNSTTLNNIREDTVHDYSLKLDEDNGLLFNFDSQTGLTVSRYSDPTASGDPNQLVDTVGLDALSPLWEAGKVLFQTAAADRRIYTPGSTAGTLASFDSTNTDLIAPGTSLLGSVANLDSCLAGADDAGTLKNLIEYIRGTDKTGCRSRTVGLCYNGSEYNAQPCNASEDCAATPLYPSCGKNVWKLGDIIYSSPQVQTDYKYCSNGTSFNTQSCSQDSDCTSTLYTSCAKKENVVFVGANDGMLHAFKTGILTNTGVDSTQHEIEKFAGIPNSESGQELWAFIPKNSLPFLRCLAVPPPNICHLYYNDLRPYITKMNVNGVTRTILIGGQRMGGGALDSIGTYCIDSSTGISNGTSCTKAEDCTAAGYTTCATANHFSAPSDTCVPSQCSDSATGISTCHNPSTCTGLSAYYALDVTDVESPKLLWEFTHPLLGYSYSGPAVIHKWADSTTKTGDRYYVMFLSGPTDASTGSSIQNVKTFVLSLDSSLGISSVYVRDFGNTTKNGFGGRLFSSGVDVNGDNYTDFVFFGYGYSASGNTGDWKGGIAKINTNNSDAALALLPTNWTYDVSTYANIAQLPITAKVEVSTCFNQLYIYAGTGRYFFPLDDYGPAGSAGRNYIMGIPFVCDQYNGTCGPNINSLNDNTNACANLQKGSAFLEQAGWMYKLSDAEDTYLRERMTTDPSLVSGNKVFFTSTEPTAEVCGYGGRTRVWGLNCATGAAISDTSCANYSVSDLTGTVYLQTSTGAINKFDPAQSFTDASTDNRTSAWTVGIPPENAPPVVAPSVSGSKTGAVIQWIEK